MLSTDKARTRAAASSMASGMPSSRWQIDATAAAFLSVSWNAGDTACARSMNRRTAAFSFITDTGCFVWSSATESVGSS